MDISRIYTRNVISVPQATTLKGAAEMMLKFHVGCLIVTENEPYTHRALGIITDRDMVVQAIAVGASPLDTTVAEVMTPTLARIAESANVHDALDKMASLGIRRLAVTDRQGAIVGVLSLDDVLDGFAVEIGGAARVLRQERIRETEAAGATGSRDEVAYAPFISL